MHPILFSISGFNFYTHGLLSVIGIVCGTVLIYLLALKKKLNVVYLFDNIVYTVLAGIIGSRISYFLLYPDQFTSIREVFYLWDGGMVSYGGFLLGSLVYILILKNQKQPVFAWLDLTIIGFSLGLFFGRIGNLFAGEYSGLRTSTHFNIDGIIPVTLYESILVLIIFGLLLYVFMKFKRIKKGMILSSFMILYGLGRFIIDFWRDEKVLFWHVTLGQIVSFNIFLAGLAVLFWLIMKDKNVKQQLSR